MYGEFFVNRRKIVSFLEFSTLGIENISKLSINLFIYESGPIEEKIEDVLFM